jgi:hypothetical protein
MTALQASFTRGPPVPTGASARTLSFRGTRNAAVGRSVAEARRPAGGVRILLRPPFAGPCGRSGATIEPDQARPGVWSLDVRLRVNVRMNAYYVY